MTDQAKILVFAGSARAGSFNKKLAAAAAGAVKDAGAEATLIDLKDFPLPLYDGDLEAADGLPENALALKRLMHAHDGLLIASPEYNGFFSPVLKNAIDWASRPDKSGEDLQPYAGKTAAVIAASPGALGGLRGLVHLRQLLTNLGVLVVPAQHAITAAHEVFGDDGTLTNDRDRDSVARIADDLVRVASRLKG